ncbi:leucine-rich repeat protein kinase family protein [Dorcoceras hygrometricum]|uniref:Leucine-rich repeat protein kinase family protein n=1 Tax=Dorcoceras hygrometricum TaxID=472368 RepID=A0A2Z7C7N9_9LAMI|nr:leucine-rich repeat protein kinase family protein [Dorcoceras hygrometricum]
MGSNPSTESNYKTVVNSKNKMQMLCMQPGTTAEGYNQGREPKNSMHSSTEICNGICGHDLNNNSKFYLNDATHGRRQQLRDLSLANNSLQEWYSMGELLERSPTLTQTYQTMAGNNGNHRIKSTVNSTRVRRTEVDNRENISLSMGSGISNQRQSLPINITRNG